MKKHWQKKIAFILTVGLSLFIQLEAEAFYCNYALQAPSTHLNSSVDDLDHYIAMFTDSTDITSYEFRIKTLNAYLHQTQPLLLRHEIEHVLNVMMDSETRTRPEMTEISLRRATEYLGLTSPQPLSVRFENLSLESQITLFLIKRHLESRDSLLSRSSALLTGQLINYVVSDIRALWPNQNPIQIYSQLSLD